MKRNTNAHADENKPKYAVGDLVVLAKPYPLGYVTSGPLSGLRSYRAEAMVQQVLEDGTRQPNYGLQFIGCDSTVDFAESEIVGLADESLRDSIDDILRRVHVAEKA